MARELKSNVEGVSVTTTATTIMTGASSRTSTNIWLSVYNSSAATDAVITLYRVPSGETLGAEHVIDLLTVVKATVGILPSAINHVLASGDTIAIKVDAGTDCYVNGSITEITG